MDAYLATARERLAVALRFSFAGVDVIDMLDGHRRGHNSGLAVPA